MRRMSAIPFEADSNLARDMRLHAREMFLAALAEADVARAFRRSVQMDRGVMLIGEDLYDLRAFENVLLVAIGKAAHTMAGALAEMTGPGLRGIVAAPTDPEPQIEGLRYFCGGHPLPNAESVRAADAILRTLHSRAHPHGLVLYMISGGGSSLVEKPIDKEMTLEDLVATYKALVHSGAPIADINAIRKHLSAVKGGRMAVAAGNALQVSILVSDVPDNALDSLASGPTMPDTSSVDACYEIATKYDLLPQFPLSVRELFEKRALEETPKPGAPPFAKSRWWTILSNATIQKAAVAGAAMGGFAVEIDNSCDDWDYAPAGDYLLNRLRELRRGVSRACLISGGEVTVKVTGGGIGGRNQQFALYCASKIAGENIAVLSGGTDGIDGNSPAAGALADGTTIQRAQALGLDPDAALRHFDAYPLFERLGDSLVTGPTGNNLRDLRILLAY